MRTIDLNAEKWKSALDFYDALLRELGAPEWHGRSINAVIDSMIWGGINTVEPPYTVRITGLDNAPPEVATEVRDVQSYLMKHREHYRAQKDRDVDVHMEIVS